MAGTHTLFAQDLSGAIEWMFKNRNEWKRTDTPKWVIQQISSANVKTGTNKILKQYNGNKDEHTKLKKNVRNLRRATKNKGYQQKARANTRVETVARADNCTSPNPSACNMVDMHKLTFGGYIFIHTEAQ